MRLPQIFARIVDSLWQRRAVARRPSRRGRVARVEALESRLALTGYIVDLSLTLTKPDGSSLTALSPGDDFLLHAWAQDVRDAPHGVFAAYMDIMWDASLAAVAGPIRYGQNY